jgi:hypothetical protein
MRRAYLSALEGSTLYLMPRRSCWRGGGVRYYARSQPMLIRFILLLVLLDSYAWQKTLSLQVEVRKRPIRFASQTMPETIYLFGLNRWHIMTNTHLTRVHYGDTGLQLNVKVSPPVHRYLPPPRGVGGSPPSKGYSPPEGVGGSPPPPHDPFPQCRVAASIIGAQQTVNIHYRGTADSESALSGHSRQ